MQVRLVLIMVFVRVLLCNGDCNIMPSDVCTISCTANKDEALIHYGWIGDKDGIRKWLECGANINAIDELYGRTALICASYNGHLEAVKFLLEKGADVNIQKAKEPNKGKTALDLAGECEVAGQCSPGADLTGEHTDEIMQQLMAARYENFFNRVVAWIRGAWETIISSITSSGINWKSVGILAAGVIILVLLIIFLIWLIKKALNCKSSCCDCELCDYEVCWGQDEVMREFVTGGESDAELTTKMKNSIKAWHGRIAKEDRLYFYYTSERLARRIEQKGFTRTDMGSDSGVYFSTIPPVMVPGCEWQDGLPEWPNKKFKKRMLKLNADEDAGCGCCSNGSQQVDAVVLVRAPSGMEKKVGVGRVFISDKFFDPEKNQQIEDEILKTVQLYE